MFGAPFIERARSMSEWWSRKPFFFGMNFMPFRASRFDFLPSRILIVSMTLNHCCREKWLIEKHVADAIQANSIEGSMNFQAMELTGETDVMMGSENQWTVNRIIDNFLFSFTSSS